MIKEQNIFEYWSTTPDFNSSITLATIYHN